MQLSLNHRQYLELEKLALGVFAPVPKFMNEAEFTSVINDMHLPNGEPFPLPIVLDISAEQARLAESASILQLTFQGVAVGELRPESIFTCDKGIVSSKVYGTSEAQHPGVADFLGMGSHFVGGAVQLLHRVPSEFSDQEWTPTETRAWFRKANWKSVVGFQTRNVPHLGHEYLLRLALEQCDGLFIQPIVGQKKTGDFTTASVLTS